MNRKLFAKILLFAVIGAFEAAAQAPFTNVPVPFTNQASATVVLTNIQYGWAAWGDYDNDGRLDLLVCGDEWVNVGGSNSYYTNVTQLWHNDGNGQFHQVAIPAPNVGYGSVAWVDYDNDGYLNFMIAGNTSGPSASNLVQLYHNQQNGTFTNVPIPGLVPTSSYSSLPGPFLSWADYDHDGRKDLAIIVPGTGAVQVWHNDGGGSFSQTFTVPALGSSINDRTLSVQWADMASDGWVDLVMCYNNFTNYEIWHNNYTNNALPLFGDAAQIGGVDNIRQTPAIADYTDDGLLDLLIYNDTSTAGSYPDQNLGGYQFSQTGALVYAGELNVSIAGDYDNDGYIDVAVTGSSTNGVAHNNGNGSFTAYSIAGLAGGSGPFLAFGDYDNDGRLDLVTGSSGNPLQLWHNTTPVTNTPPTAPTGLNAVPTANGVVLSWNPASDAQTPTAGLSYNIYVGTVPGTDNYSGAEANLATGWRRVPERGPIQGTNYTMTQMLAGTYYWSVQAIDSAFAGGPFGAEGTFSIPGLAVTPAYCENITASSAVLYSTGTTGGTPTTGYFQWGLTTSYGNTTAPQSLGSKVGAVVPFHQGISGLEAPTFYHFNSVVTNGAAAVYSPDNMFYTDPTVLIGDTNGSGTITATEAGVVFSNYLQGGLMVLTNPAAMGAGKFGFTLTGITGWSLPIEASSDLMHWSNLPAPATLFYKINDPYAISSPQRFYHVGTPLDEATQPAAPLSAGALNGR